MISRGIGHVAARRDRNSDADPHGHARPAGTGSGTDAVSYGGKIVSLLTRGLVIAAGRAQAWHPGSKQIR